MFLEVKLTIYDPLDRGLDLRDMSHFWFSNPDVPTVWKDKKTSGIYAHCGQYFIAKKLKDLGLKWIEKGDLGAVDGTIRDPVPVLECNDRLSLMIYTEKCLGNGKEFPEEELKTIREMLGFSDFVGFPTLV